jgi:uncharacterized protein (DUF433 family)
MKFERITVDPKQMNGVPCIRGLRIPVKTIIGMLAEGMTEKQILDAYPDLDKEDIKQALRFTSEMLDEHEISLEKTA